MQHDLQAAGLGRAGLAGFRNVEIAGVRRPFAAVALPGTNSFWSKATMRPARRRCGRAQILPVDRLQFGAGLVVVAIVDVGRGVGVARAAEVLRHPGMSGLGGRPAPVFEDDVAGGNAERVVERLALLDGLGGDHVVRTAGEEIDFRARQVGGRVDPALGGKLFEPIFVGRDVVQQEGDLQAGSRPPGTRARARRPPSRPGPRSRRARLRSSPRP